MKSKKERTGEGEDFRTDTEDRAFPLLTKQKGGFLLFAIRSQCCLNKVP